MMADSILNTVWIVLCTIYVRHLAATYVILPEMPEQQSSTSVLSSFDPTQCNTNQSYNADLYFYLRCADVFLDDHQMPSFLDRTNDVPLQLDIHSDASTCSEFGAKHKIITLLMYDLSGQQRMFHVKYLLSNLYSLYSVINLFIWVLLLLRVTQNSHAVFYAFVFCMIRVSVSDFICNTTNECENGVYECNDHEDCNILCSSDNACYNASFICPTNGNCSIFVFDGYEVARQAIIDASNTISGSLNIHIDTTGETNANPMYASTILCPVFGDCIIEVAPTDSSDFVWRPVAGSRIVAQETTNSLSITGTGYCTLCGAEIYCPPHNCTITITGAWNSFQLESTHIYVYDGSRGLNVYCESTRSEGGCTRFKSQPQKHCTYDPTQLCTLTKNSDLSYTCSDALHCPTKYANYSFLCDEDHECKDGVYRCTDTEDCSIFCRSDFACRNASFICPTHGNCIMHAWGASVAESATIDASNTISGDLAIYLNKQGVVSAMEKSTILCPMFGDCIIQTEEYASQQAFSSARIVAQETTNSLSITGNGQCILCLAEIYCPPHHCNITITAPGPDFYHGSQLESTIVYVYDSNDLNLYCESTDSDGGCASLTAQPEKHCIHDVNRSCTLIRNLDLRYTCTDELYCPTDNPTTDPTSEPTRDPTNPTFAPTTYPTRYPTHDPTADPTLEPTYDPTNDPTVDPTMDPTTDPTTPTNNPTIDPTRDPTIDPTIDPTRDPTIDPTIDPTSDPTMDPTRDPTSDPTRDPTTQPTTDPTTSPTVAPSIAPTGHPSSFAELLDGLTISGEAGAGGFQGEMLVTLGLGSLSLFILVLAVFTKRNDDQDYEAVALYLLQCFDLYSDVILAALLYNYYLQAQSNTTVFDEQQIGFLALLCWVCILSAVIPYFLNIFTSIRIIGKLSREKNIPSFTKDYFDSHTSVYALGVLLNGGCYTTLALLNSKLFNLPLFNSGLSMYKLRQFEHFKIFNTVVLENLPQICVQGLALYTFGEQTSIVFGSTIWASFITSLLSVLLSIMIWSLRRIGNNDYFRISLKLSVRDV
eukprot:382188_1